MKIIAKSICLAILGGLGAVPLEAQAVHIEYEWVALGGTAYRYDYTVSNDGSLGVGVSLQIFDILFDPGLYQETSLTIVTSDPPAADWTETLFPANPTVGEFSAFYDAQARYGGIPVGTSVSGFAVEFAWLGGPTGPGTQPFRIYDALTFALLEEGATQLQSPPCTRCPAPGTLPLLGLGLWPLAWRWLAAGGKRYNASAVRSGP
jgi:hypothetical protein